MSDVQQVKDAIDVVDFIGEYVQLKPAGVNYKGLCPFHREKSPSFMASRERQSWHCFGCNKGGDIFSFLQEVEGMNFIEALQYLAGRAGITLTQKRDEVQADQKNRLREICSQAVHFFHNFLTQMQASTAAREYLQHRGLTDETIATWQIGYIPDQWDLLTKYLTKKGYSIDDLVTAGFTIKRDKSDATSGRGFYDRFRGRIMFPLHDVHGSVVGFTGRVLIETEHSGGKYVNTPQSPLFDKSKVIFGLSKAKQAIKKANLVVLVEGQMDVIASHQAGIENVVATSGTAMTEAHVDILKRYTKNIAMAFDMDDAGQRAAERGIDIAVAAGMNVKIIRIPDYAGKDPDECIKKDSNVWRQAIADAQDEMEWHTERNFQNKQVSNPKDKQAIANALVPKLVRIPFAIERDHWVQVIAQKLGVDPALIREEVNKSASAKKSEAKEQSAITPPAEKTRLDQLIDEFLALILKYPHLTLDTWPLNLPHPLYEEVRKQYTTGHAIEDDRLLRQLNVLLLKGDEDFSHISGEDAQRRAAELLQYIKTEWMKAERLRIGKAIDDAPDEHTRQVLLVEFQKLRD